MLNHKHDKVNLNEIGAEYSTKFLSLLENKTMVEKCKKLIIFSFVSYIPE